MVKRKRLKYRVLWRGGVHRLVYGRWTTRYVDFLFNRLIPALGKRGKRRLAHSYHSKVLTQEHAEKLVTVDRNIPLQDLERIIPYEKARDLVLHGPPEIAVFECGCRQSSDDPCRPTRVCMVVGQPFVDLIIGHRPDDSRRLTTDEAVALLREEHERGHVHCAWFKHAMMGRFYAICNCCKCHCGGIEAMTRYGVPMIAASGFSAQRDPELCVDCGICAAVCPFDALEMKGGGLVFHDDKCMGCGVCVSKCPHGAIKLVRDDSKGAPLDVEKLITQ